MAAARMGCCTQLLYGMTRASKNAVKAGLTSYYQLGNWFVMLCQPQYLQLRAYSTLPDRVRGCACTSADLMDDAAPSRPLCCFLPALIERSLRRGLFRLLVLVGCVSLVRLMSHEPMVVATLTSIGQGALGAVTDCAAARFRVWCLFAV
jgi:hypothetical protein